MSILASSWASCDSGTWTAIWSPSKSALKAAQVSGCSWIAFPSIRTGSKAWMPSRCRVGARLSMTGMVLGDELQDVPDLRAHLLEHALGGLERQALGLHQLADDERAEELERHLLGQAALVELEVRADHDDGAAGIVHALAEQVLAEAALLALQDVGQGLERAGCRRRRRLGRERRSRRERRRLPAGGASR